MAARVQAALVALGLMQLGMVQATLQTEEPKHNPIKKVVALLQEMKAQVETEAKQDLEAYDKYMCWCQTNEKEQAAAIDETEQNIQDLTAFLDEAAGKEGALKTQITSLKQSIQEGQDTLASAAANREKASAAFQSEEKDTKQSVALLKQALEALSKLALSQHGAKSQVARRQAATALIQVRDKVARHHPEFKNVMQRDLFDVLGSLEELDQAQRQAYSAATRFGEAFLPKRDGAALEQQQGGVKKPSSYDSKSGAIVGILGAQLDRFSQDLAASQKADLQAEISFQSLRAAKTAEIAAATEQIKQKQAELADLLAQVATSKADLEKQSQALNADREFLVNLQQNCQAEDEAYKSRSRDRDEEIRALGETLQILTEDEARDLFGKTMSFLQVQASSNERARQELTAHQALRHVALVARKHKDWELLALAGRARLDSFTKVKEAMDAMLAEMAKQQKEEYEKREYCNKVIDETEDLIKEATYTKEDLDQKHLGLTNTLETLKREIDQLTADVKGMEVALKQAGEQRKAANKLFQSSLSDQRATVQILQKAQKRLQAFYAFVEVHQHSVISQEEPGQASSAAPPKPQGYSKHGTAGGVLQLLALIVKDAETAQITLEKDEQHSQKLYAKFVQDTANSIEADRRIIQEKTAQVAATEGDKSETQAAQLANNEELKKLDGLLQAHHVDCDFLLQYFDVRQKTRAEEMDGINDAKAILSGANFGK